LIAYGDEQSHAVALQKQFDDAQHSRELVLHRYQAGLAAYNDVLTAERNAHQAEQSLAQSNVDATTDLVALFKALGGGWSDDSAEPIATN
jgi:outer membrane protein TolC